MLFIELCELVLTAQFAAREQKAPIIHKTSVKLDALKFFLQVAWELKSIENKIFADLVANISEAGKMLGGWQKHLGK